MRQHFASQSKRPKRARALVVSDSKKVALIEREVRGRHYWSLPGGRIKSRETPAEAAVRETLEETGLHITVGQPIGQFGRTVIFFASRMEGTPQLVMSGPELRHADRRNRYQPQWVAMKRVRGLRVKPKGVAVLIHAVSRRSDRPAA